MSNIALSILVAGILIFGITTVYAQESEDQRDSYVPPKSPSDSEKEKPYVPPSSEETKPPYIPPENETEEEKIPIPPNEEVKSSDAKEEEPEKVEAIKEEPKVEKVEAEPEPELVAMPPEETYTPEPEPELQAKSSSEGGGCLIATAAYGSELAPQVQFLREIRDNTVMSTQSGTSFMTGFNQFYYSFSPTVADYERENPVFKEAVKVTLIPLLTSLTLLNYVDVDTEEEMLGYGIGIILLNIGMYFVAPVTLIITLKKRFL